MTESLRSLEQFKITHWIVLMPHIDANTVQSGSIAKVLLQVKNNQFNPLYFIALVLHLYLD